ncbi:MAG: metallopeptidase TldD-related protein [Candidatus Woesearchaeota archaeon]
MIELILKPMEAELKRSKDISIKGIKEKVYYISNHIRESKSYNIIAEDGTLVHFNPSHKRQCDVRVGLGSYNDDSSGSAHSEITLDGHKDNTHKRITDNIRRVLWISTDKAYEMAISEDLKRKERIAREQVKLSSLFSKQPRYTHIEKYKPLEFNVRRWKGIARELSDLISRDKRVLISDVSVSANKDWDYFVNTEGSRIFHQSSFYNLRLYASARGLDHKRRKEDGTEVNFVKVYHLRDYKELPSFKKLASDAEKLIETLDKLRKAEKLRVSETYPAILNQSSHATFWHEVVGHRFEMRSVNIEQGEEGDDEGDDDECGMGDDDFSSMKNRKITNSLITIEMDPTLRKYNGKSLNGHYKFDDEGVKPKKVTLIKNGRIKDFLMGRQYRGYESLKKHKSNGHGRYEDPSQLPSPRMSNLIIRSENPCTTEELKGMLLEECRKQGKEFGFIIRDFEVGGYTSLGEGYFSIDPTLIYKVDAKTGKESLVRGLRIIGTRLHALEGIIAMDDDYSVSHGNCGSDSGWIPVSEIAPRALMKRIEFKSQPQQNKRKLILPPPRE